MRLNEFVLWQMACLAYKLILRGMLKAAIDDPDTEWDDRVLAALDTLFNYHEGD